MTTELQESKVCIGEVSEIGKQARNRKKYSYFLSLTKTPLAASELPLLLKAKQIFFSSLKQDSI